MRKLLTVVGAMLLAIPALAEDQSAVNPPPYAQAPSSQVGYNQPPAEMNPAVPSGELIAGAGFGGFTSDLGRASSVGAAWNVRVGFNGARYLGGELAYAGMVNSVNSVFQQVLTPQSSTSFVENQITADFKLGYPILAANRILRPYAIAGVGYAHIGVDSALATVGLPSENVAAFPFGVGISYNITPGFVVDGRYTYNVLTDTVGNNWNVGFNLGATFGG